MVEVVHQGEPDLPEGEEPQDVAPDPSHFASNYEPKREGHPSPSNQ
jgi:hypothetical protein